MRASDAVRPSDAAVAAVVTAGVVVSLVAFDPGGFRPFTTLRWPILAGAVLLAGALAVIGTAGSTPWPRWLRATGLAFAAWMVLATVTAVDPLHAWIGHPRRHLGLVGWIVAAVALGVGTRLRSDRARRIVGRGLAVAAAVTGVAALVELAGVEPASIGFAGPRIGGLFGQPAYLGAAGVLLVPVAASLAGRAGEQAAAWRGVARLGAVTATVAVVASQTRGAWAGLAVAAVVAWPALGPKDRRPAALLAGGFAVALVIVAAVTPIGARAWSTIEVGSGTTGGRLAEWRAAAAVVADHWLVGVGPEGYRTVATAHIDDDYTARYGRAVVVDRAHDGLLDVAVTGGLPAAVLYGAAAVGTAALLWRARRDHRPIVVGASAAVIGHLVQQLVLFPVAELDPLAWLLAGLVLAARAPARAPPPTAPPAGRRGRSLVAAGALGTLALAVVLAGGADAVADRRLAGAQAVWQAGDQPDALAAADAATRLRPDSIDTWYVAAKVAAGGPTIVDLDAGLDRVESGLRRSPADPALGDLHEELLAERARRSELPDDVRRASDAVAERLAADPANPQHHRLAAMLLAIGARGAGHGT